MPQSLTTLSLTGLHLLTLKYLADSEYFLQLGENSAF